MGLKGMIGERMDDRAIAGAAAQAIGQVKEKT